MAMTHPPTDAEWPNRLSSLLSSIGMAYSLGDQIRISGETTPAAHSLLALALAGLLAKVETCCDAGDFDRDQLGNIAHNFRARTMSASDIELSFARPAARPKTVHWIPEAFLDEVSPPPTDSPAAWIGVDANGAIALVEPTPWSDPPYTIPLRNLDEIAFAWVVDLGTIHVTVRGPDDWSSLAGLSFQSSVPGTTIQYCVRGSRDPEATLEDVVAAILETEETFPVTETVFVHAWSNAPVHFIYRDGLMIEKGASL